MPFVVLVTGLIVGGMALLLLLNTASAANEVRRHNISARDQTVAAMVQDLQNEVAASAAPGNLARAAAALGMVPAVNPAFLVIAGNGNVQVLGSPAQVTDPPLPAPPVTHSATSSKSASKSPSNTASRSASKTTGTSTSPGNGRHVTSKSANQSSTHAAPPPSPTPTPTLTLPGGHR